MKKTIVIGSTSPRRKEITTKYLSDNYNLIFDSPTFDETELKLNITDPYLLTTELSKNKALSLSSKYKDTLIIGADTVVSYNNKILNKPKDKEDAFNMLKLLNDNTHEVITGYNFVCNSKVILSKVCVSKTHISKMSDEEILTYIETGSPLDKAGSYGIQDKDYITATFKTENDFFNIMGFPIFQVIEDLKEIEKEEK